MPSSHPDGVTIRSATRADSEAVRRGRGLGRRLLDHSLARARVLGFRVVVLQTATILGDAIALYRRAGFRPYEPAHRVPRCDVALRLDLVESATAESRPTGGQP